MSNKYIVSEENLKSMSLEELEELTRLLTDDYKKALQGGTAKKLQKLRLANIAAVIAAVAGAAVAVSHIFFPEQAGLAISSTGLAISLGSLASSIILNKKNKNVIKETNHLNEALCMTIIRQHSIKHSHKDSKEQCNLDDDNNKISE